MFTRILIPLDGSEPAESILRLAGFIARAGNAEIVLLRVVEYPYQIYARLARYNPFDSNQMEKIRRQKEAIRSEVENYLRRIASEIAATRVKVTTRVCEGPVVESILSSAENLRADLIVLSNCGNGGGNPWKIGAVADRVLRESRVPVMLIRAAPAQSFPVFQRAQDQSAGQALDQALNTERYANPGGAGLEPRFTRLPFHERVRLPAGE